MSNVDVARIDLAARLLYDDAKPCDLIWKISVAAYGKHRVHSGHSEATKSEKNIHTIYKYILIACSLLACLPGQTINNNLI